MDSYGFNNIRIPQEFLCLQLPRDSYGFLLFLFAIPYCRDSYGFLKDFLVFLPLTVGIPKPTSQFHTG